MGRFIDGLKPHFDRMMPALGENMTTGLLAQAKARVNPNAARALADWATYYLAKDCQHPMPDALREWLMESMAAIAQDQPLDKALSLNVHRGRRRDPFASGEYRIASECHYSTLKIHKEPGGRYYEIGRQFNLSASAVEAIYAKWRKAFDDMDRAE